MNTKLEAGQRRATSNRTLVVKLQDELGAWLDRHARDRGIPRSAVIRAALEAYRVGSASQDNGSFFAKAQDLAGSLDGPANLASSPSRFDGFGR